VSSDNGVGTAEVIRTQVTDGAGRILLNRPHKRNALNGELFRRLIDQLDAWRDDDAVAAVVITGGERCFSAGLDLDGLATFTREEQEAWNDTCERAYGALLTYPKPTIAAVAGPALGGGCDVAVFCDIRVASEDATFGFPQVRFGLTPYISPLWRLVGISRAKVMVLTGEVIDGREASRIGLIDVLVPAGGAETEALRMARAIARTGTRTARITKEMAMRSPTMEPGSALAYETALYRDISWQPETRQRIAEARAQLSAARARRG
jgi:3-hydroxypropionyl-coenzyme A dehydratase